MVVVVVVVIVVVVGDGGVCVCVCVIEIGGGGDDVCVGSLAFMCLHSWYTNARAHTHTHTNIHAYIYIFWPALLYAGGWHTICKGQNLQQLERSCRCSLTQSLTQSLTHTHIVTHPPTGNKTLLYGNFVDPRAPAKVHFTYKT